MFMVCDAFLLVHFAIILVRKRKLINLLKLSSCCPVAVYVLCLFLAVPWVGMWTVIVAFPGDTDLLFETNGLSIWYGMDM